MVTRTSSSHNIFWSYSANYSKSRSVDCSRSRSNNLYCADSNQDQTWSEVDQVRNEFTQRLELMDSNILSVASMVRWLQVIG